MKRKGFKIFLKINIVILLGSIVLSIVIWNNNYGYKSDVQGTGFVYDQRPNFGDAFFDVDSKGRLYFGGEENVITVYDKNGIYIHTLPLTGTAGGTTSVKIDENDRITVYASKGEAIYIYKQNGFLEEVVDDKNFVLGSDYFTDYKKTREKPNGTIYMNEGGKILKLVNGVTVTILEEPFMQRLYKLLFKIIFISTFTLFIGCIVVYWITKAYVPYMERKNNKDKG